MCVVWSFSLFCWPHLKLSLFLSPSLYVVFFSMARIGHSSMTADQLTENIEAAVKTVMAKLRMVSLWNCTSQSAIQQQPVVWRQQLSGSLVWLNSSELVETPGRRVFFNVFFKAYLEEGTYPWWNTLKRIHLCSCASGCKKSHILCLKNASQFLFCLKQTWIYWLHIT